MFRIAAITRVGLLAVACVAVAAPQALAKSPVKGGKAKVAKVQSVKKAVSSSSDSVVFRANLSTAYAQGCQNGTVPDRMTGGDNNNYEYYGDVCTALGADQHRPGASCRKWPDDGHPVRRPHVLRQRHDRVPARGDHSADRLRRSVASKGHSTGCQPASKL